MYGKTEKATSSPVKEVSLKAFNKILKALYKNGNRAKSKFWGHSRGADYETFLKARCFNAVILNGSVHRTYYQFLPLVTLANSQCSEFTKIRLLSANSLHAHSCRLKAGSWSCLIWLNAAKVFGRVRQTQVL